MAEDELRKHKYQPNAVRELTDALMAPVSDYRHERPHAVSYERTYSEIPKRPRRFKKPEA